MQDGGFGKGGLQVDHSYSSSLFHARLDDLGRMDFKWTMSTIFDARWRIWEGLISSRSCLPKFCF